MIICFYIWSRLNWTCRLLIILIQFSLLPRRTDTPTYLAIKHINQPIICLFYYKHIRQTSNNSRLSNHLDFVKLIHLLCNRIGKEYWKTNQHNIADDGIWGAIDIFHTGESTYKLNDLEGDLEGLTADRNYADSEKKIYEARGFVETNGMVNSATRR